MDVCRCSGFTRFIPSSTSIIMTSGAEQARVVFPTPGSPETIMMMLFCEKSISDGFTIAISLLLFLYPFAAVVPLKKHSAEFGGFRDHCFVVDTDATIISGIFHCFVIRNGLSVVGAYSNIQLTNPLSASKLNVDIFVLRRFRHCSVGAAFSILHQQAECIVLLVCKE